MDTTLLRTTVAQLTQRITDLELRAWPPRSPCYPPPNCRRVSVAPALSHSRAAVGNSKRRRSPSPPGHPFDERRVRKKRQRRQRRRGHQGQALHAPPVMPLCQLLPYHLLRQRLPPGACCQRLAAHAYCPSTSPAALTLFPSVSSARRVSVVLQLIHGAFYLDLLSIPCLHEASLNFILFVLG
ncbi:hypothetical protein K438DRAFT_2002357 [Mycena galopus ATCC 62051]|nr:hypothetical protein K438DRAFT_2002357 [Mycena galopus ATCC 62051]